MTEREKLMLKKLENESLQTLVKEANSGKSEEKLDEESNFSD